MSFTFQMCQGHTHTYVPEKEQLNVQFNFFKAYLSSTNEHLEYDVTHTDIPRILDMYEQLLKLHDQLEFELCAPMFTYFSKKEVNQFFPERSTGHTLYEMLHNLSLIDYEHYLAMLIDIYTQRKQRVEYIESILAHILEKEHKLVMVVDGTFWNCWLIATYVIFGHIYINGHRLTSDKLNSKSGRVRFEMMLYRLSGVDKWLKIYETRYRKVCGKTYDTVVDDKIRTFTRSLSVGEKDRMLNNFIYFGRLEKDGDPVEEKRVAEVIFKQRILNDWLKQLNIELDFDDEPYDWEKEHMIIHTIEHDSNEWKLIKEFGFNFCGSYRTRFR